MAKRKFASLDRSVAIWRAYGVEQVDPDSCYRQVALDAAAHVEQYQPLAGQRILDIGGGPGFFADAFQARGAHYAAVDANAGELTLHGRTPPPGTLQASALALPFRDESFDIAYSSNVIEHVPQPWVLADEAMRVLKPGGLAFLSYTLWWGPHGGHETSPWHYFGGDYARRRYEQKVGKSPKNVFNDSMFAVTAKAGLQWAQQQTSGTLIDVCPRYHPAWARWVVHIPLVREVVTWNLCLILRKDQHRSALKR